MGYSKFVKRYCFSIVKKLPLMQIHFLQYMPSECWPLSNKMAIEISGKIINDNCNLYNPFNNLFKDERASNLIKRVYTNNLINICTRYYVLKVFIDKHQGDKIYYYPTDNNIIIRYIKEYSNNTVLISWHFFVLKVVKFIENIAQLILLLVTPYLIIAKLMWNHRIRFICEKQEIIRKAIVFHHNHEIDKRCSVKYRDQYFFNESILKIDDCLHSGTFKPFSKKKKVFLTENGGYVYDYMSTVIPAKYIINFILINYYRCFTKYFASLAFCSFTSISKVYDIVGMLSKCLDINYFLLNVNAKLAFFESEMGYVSTMFTIIANKKDIKTLTMAHGYGYCNPDFGRANMVVNYFIVQGRYYRKYLFHDNPDVDNYCLAGDIEIDNILNKDSNKLIKRFNKNGKKIVTIFVDLSIFLPGAPVSFHRLLGKVFDSNEAKTQLKRCWDPFIEWAKTQKDIFFIFKGKVGRRQYAHPFLKEYLLRLPPENYYQDDDLSVENLVYISDCTISTGNSGTLYSALSFGRPAISYNFIVPGYVPVVEYDKHLVATNPDELISNLTYILKHGIPKDVFGKVRRDHYAEGNLDFKAAERIRELVNKIISS